MKTHNATMFLRAGVLLAVALTLSKRERRWGEAEPSRVRYEKWQRWAVGDPVLDGQLHADR